MNQEAIIPRIPDLSWLAEVGKEIAASLRAFAASADQINTLMYERGFMQGVVSACTVLAAIWCFANSRRS